MNEENITSTKFPHYCPSNACMNIFPDNKPQHYKIQLDQPYHFTGSWQVALHSITYPNNWYNVKETFLTFYIPQRMLNNDNTFASTCRIVKGQYTTITEVIAHLNKSIQNCVKGAMELMTQRFEVAYDPDTKYFEFKETETYPKKITLITHNAVNKIIIEEHGLDIFGILGFDSKTQRHLSNGTVGKFQPTLDLHFPSLYIYCPNLIKGVGVGEGQSQLLATVPVQSKIHSLVNVQFLNPIYIDLINNYINEIEIEIKTDSGNFVEFLAGKVLLVLMFKRIG